MTAGTSFSVGLVQTACRPAPHDNRDTAFAGVRTAAANGAQIVCLPELFCSEYFCQVEDSRHFDLAEPIPGPSTEQAADRKSTRLNSSHSQQSRMPSSA